MKSQKPNKAAENNAEIGKPTSNGYSIERYQSGYVVMKNDKRVTEPNMWPIAMKALERMLRTENGLL